MSALTLIEDDDNTPKPTASFVTVTPEVAKRWLKRNARNRNLRAADLNRYKRDMVAGRWHLDGAPIRFALNGDLLDGQHRLTAIVETGLPLPLLVVRGINPDAQSVMDTGRRRTAADALALNGHANSTLLAATARLLILHENADLNQNKTEVTHEEVLAAIDANPDLAPACDFIKSFARRTDCPPAVVAYSCLVLRRIDSKAAAEFWVGLADKVGLREGDPVIALHNRFAEARRNREHLPKHSYLSLIFRAWNLRRDGKTARYLRIQSATGGLIPIPEPK